MRRGSLKQRETVLQEKKLIQYMQKEPEEENWKEIHSMELSLIHIFQDIPAEDMPLEEFERVIKVNLTGAFISSRAAGKAMIKQKSGSIILTASMSGHIVNIPQCQCAYNSSKAGVILLGKSLAIEWAKHGIRVNTVSPGYIRTWSDEPLKPEEVGQSNFEQWTPLKRFGAASESAGIIVYLASEESSFVTGSDFVVDGGYTAF